MKPLHNTKTLIIVAVVFFIVGYLVKQAQKVPVETVTHTIEDLESKQKLAESLRIQQELEEKLVIAQQTISELQLTVNKKEKIIYYPDGTKIVEKDTTTVATNTTNTAKVETNTKTETNVVDYNKQEEIDFKAHIDTKTIVTVMPKDNFFLGISARASTAGLDKPGIDFKYRMFDISKVSFWIGLEVIASPNMELSKTEFRPSIGGSF